jgi:hypothetical protein
MWNTGREGREECGEGNQHSHQLEGERKGATANRSVVS